MTSLVFADIETTGLSANSDQIIELGAARMVDRKIVATFQAYVRPRVRVTPGAFAIHGLSDDFLSKFEGIRDVYPRFSEFLGDDDVMIHNAPFDVGFLNAETGGALSARHRVTDTLVMARANRPRKRNSLDVLVKEFGIPLDRSKHGAMDDSVALAHVWLAMTAGQETMDVSSVVDSRPMYAPVTERTIVRLASPEELEAHRNYMLKHKMAVF